MHKAIGGRTVATLAAFASLLAACDGGGGTSVPTPGGISASSQPTQQAAPGAAVAEAPAVVVVDGQGQPLPGVGVTFAVTAGGGSIATPLATTNASGVASAGTWTLGPNAGTNTVTATVSGLAPVTFTAEAGDPCDNLVPYTLFATAQGTLTAQDCSYDGGEFVDLYAVALPQARAVTFTMSSNAVDTWLQVYDEAGNFLASHYDTDTPTGTATARVFAPAGNYVIGATSYAPGETGAYTLGSAALTGNVNCELPYVVPGVQIGGQVSASDCELDGYYSDQYYVVLYEGEQLQVSMESDEVDSFLILENADGLVAYDDDSGDGLDAVMTYTAPRSAVYLIDAGTASTGETGAYTLRVVLGGGSASRAAAAGPRLSREQVVGARSGLFEARPSAARLRKGAALRRALAT